MSRLGLFRVMLELVWLVGCSLCVFVIDSIKSIEIEINLGLMAFGENFLVWE